MAIQKVVLDFFGDPAGFCCPDCGHRIFTEDAQEGLCRHTVFVGEDITGEYQWNNPVHEKKTLEALQAKYDALEDVDKSDYDFEFFLDEEGIDGVFSAAVESIESPSAFSLCVTTSGMGCGPTSSTVYAIVDYNPEE